MISGALGFALAADPPIPHQLSAKEKVEGWQLLFDGKTTTGWRNFGKTAFPKGGWEVVDGCLHLVPKAQGGDIVTEACYRNFEFSFEWKLAPNANSGVKYFILEDRKAAIGHEYQLLDDPKAIPTAPNKGDTAGLYDVLPPAPSSNPVRAGEFYQSLIRVEGSKVEHWLNGRLTLTYELGSEPLREAIQKSKFKGVAGFGESQEGRILLQDHGGEVWFRNLKIRRLNVSK